MKYIILITMVLLIISFILLIIKDYYTDKEENKANIIGIGEAIIYTILLAIIILLLINE